MDLITNGRHSLLPGATLSIFFSLLSHAFYLLSTSLFFVCWAPLLLLLQSPPFIIEGDTVPVHRACLPRHLAPCDRAGQVAAPAPVTRHLPPHVSSPPCSGVVTSSLDLWGHHAGWPACLLLPSVLPPSSRVAKEAPRGYAYLAPPGEPPW